MSLGARAASPAAIFFGCAGEGEVNRAWWWCGGLAEVRALLLRRRRGLECSADIVTECGVGQDGEALARVECGGRHCDCCSKAGYGCLVVGWRSRKIGGDVVIKSTGWV